MTRSVWPVLLVGETSPAFVCEHCGQAVPGQAPGTRHRNHCPYCLWSLQVDLRTGDRRSGCQGLMEPIAVSVQANGEWSMVHRCSQCGLIRLNRIAGDDNEILLLSVALKPLAQPPFPLDRVSARLNPDGGRTGSTEWGEMKHEPV